MFMKLKSKLKLLMGKITKSERNDTIFTAVALVILVTLIAVTWRIFFYKAPFNPWEHEEPQLARLTGADTALFRAVRGGGMKDILRSLLEGGSPDAVNENGVTPFKAAIALSRLDAVREFIETGRGDIDSYKTAGKWDTLLVYAVVHNRPPIVKELAKLSPNVNALDGNGYTPLLYAVNYNHVNAAKELLNAGADVNAPGREGVTPLIAAVTRGRPDMVAELLKAGANAAALSPSGETAMSIAQRNKRDSVIGLLMEAEAPDKDLIYEEYMKLPEDMPLSHE